jgi:hypothetical protein
LSPAGEGAQGIQLKKLLILEASLKIILLAIQGIGNLKLRLRFQLAVWVLLEKLLIVLAGLPLTLLAERLVAQTEIVFWRLRLFLLGTTAERGAADPAPIVSTQNTSVCGIGYIMAST